MKNLKLKLALFGLGVLMHLSIGGFGGCLGDLIGDIIVLRGVD